MLFHEKGINNTLMQGIQEGNRNNCYQKQIVL